MEKKTIKFISCFLAILCLFACTNKKSSNSSPIKAQYGGQYHTVLDYEVYIKYHGYFISSGKLLNSSNQYEVFEYSLGSDTYQIITLNDINFSFDAYSSNDMYEGSSYCDNQSTCSINLNDYFYIYDNILLSLNTPKEIIENLKTCSIKDSSNIDYYKDGNIFTIDDFIEALNLKVKETKELDNNIEISTFRNVDVIFEDESEIILCQIGEDYINAERNDTGDQIVNLYNTSCFLNDYCITNGISEDGYIICQNLMLKVINDNGRDFENFFRNMNY